MGSTAQIFFSLLIGSFFDSVGQTKESWNPPDGGQEQVRGLMTGSLQTEKGGCEADPPNIIKLLEFSTSILKEEFEALFFALRNITIAASTLHFANEGGWILLQVGPRTNELKSSCSGPQYITPFYYTVQTSYSF